MGTLELAPLNTSLLFGIVNQGGNVAEAEVALEDTIGDPADLTNWDGYIRNNRILWNSIFTPKDYGGRVDNDPLHFDSGWISIGRKGWLYPEDQGPQIFVYNFHGDALPADILISNYVIYDGVVIGV